MYKRKLSFIQAINNNYRTIITQNIVQWLNNDLASLRAELLEETSIYFYPNTTIGTISAVVDNGIVRDIEASQSFTVSLSVTKLVYEDIQLRNRLKISTISTIADLLTKSTISNDIITTALRTQYGTDVVAIHVSGLGGVNNYSVLTIPDNAKRCSIKKRLTALANRSLIVEEDINVEFVLYEK